jgi:hypothetical protein
MKAHGDTALWDALALASDQIIDYAKKFPNAKKRIICLSDGNDNMSKQKNSDLSLFLSVCGSQDRIVDFSRFQLTSARKTMWLLIHSASEMKITWNYVQFHTSLAGTSSSQNHWNKRWQFVRWNLS